MNPISFKMISVASPGLDLVFLSHSEWVFWSRASFWYFTPLLLGSILSDKDTLADVLVGCVAPAAGNCASAWIEISKGLEMLSAVRTGDQLSTKNTSAEYHSWLQVDLNTHFKTWWWSWIKDNDKVNSTPWKVEESLCVCGNWEAAVAVLRYWKI